MISNRLCLVAKRNLFQVFGTFESISRYILNPFSHDSFSQKSSTCQEICSKFSFAFTIFEQTIVNLISSFIYKIISVLIF